MVVETVAGQFIMTLDNGILTYVRWVCGIKSAQVIDESVNRLPNLGESYTLHSRDIYAYAEARLATGIITLEQVGPVANVDNVVEPPVAEAMYDGKKTNGTIDIPDVKLGSL